MERQQSQPVSLPFGEFLRTWLYLPLTIWKDTFESFYHPQLFLGCNIQDMDDEYHVLNKVGSYGKQLSQIQKVLDVFLAHPPAELTEGERQALDEFRSYTARVAAALAESRGPRPNELTTGYVDRLGEALRVMSTAQPQEFALVFAALARLVSSESELAWAARETKRLT